MAGNDWGAVHALLWEEELRYRRERLRTGAGAQELPAEAEAEVVAAARSAVEIYLVADETQRSEMRALFAGSYSLRDRLWTVFGDALAHVRESGAEESLLLAFGALSLEDGVTDCRDTYLAIHDAASVGHRALARAADVQQRVASISSRRTADLLRGGALHMARFS